MAEIFLATGNARRASCTSLLILLLILTGLVVPPGASAQTNEDIPAPAELKKLSIEQLMDLEVTLVSKRPERLSESPSAIQVITAEDIRRSSAKNLPEALRLAPNLQVAQVTAHDWAITARGLNGAPLGNNALADKLLVMIDGRSVYSPLFGGVFWDVQSVLLEDVDRVEVVSGPGGSLWGANAVNGVINIVTKSSRDTQGAYVSGAGGSFMEDYGAARYGGAITSNLFYRVYVQRYDFDNTKFNGADLNDSWNITQGGFRTDYYPSEINTLTFQGDFYGGDEGSPVVTDFNGQNVLGRWQHTISAESDLTVQAYFDRTWRKIPPAGTTDEFSDDMKTYDLDFQHRFPIGSRQSILWGGGYRFMQDDVNNNQSLSFSPEERDLNLFNGFVQDEIALVPDQLTFVLGTKLEHNTFSGFEVQPSARLAWTPVTNHTAWAAVSRAVRSPARLDSDATIGVLPVGNKDFDSEKVIAYELGYRVRPLQWLSLSVAGYYNQYDDIRSLNAPLVQFNNDQEADTWGVELSANIQATDWWRLRGGYTYFHSDFSTTDPAVIPGSDRLEGLDPHHQVLIQSVMDLPYHFQLDVIGRYVDQLLASPITGTATVPSYIAVDVRIAWHYKNWEISIVGQNLGDDSHPEFASEIPRSIFGKITWRF